MEESILKQYIELCKRALACKPKPNRTGIDARGFQSAMMQFDLAEGFPIVTTKKVNYRTCFAEMLGFWRGYDSAAHFRELGCSVWDANANENKTWLNNPYRRGEDDLGRVYGVQARDWAREVDQLRVIYDALLQRIDNRRLIVTHWNPGELDVQALPPCHLLYQFGLDGERLNMLMYQRSCDLALGVPFNISGYAWLLCVMARITGLVPGMFTHVLWDVHVYENHVAKLQEQIERLPLPLPRELVFEGEWGWDEMETTVTPDHFTLPDYFAHDPIKYDMAV